MKIKGEGGSPNRSISLRPYKIDLALSEILENELSKKWERNPDRLFGHFMSALALVFLRNRKNKKFIAELDKAHEDIDNKNVTDINIDF